MGRVFLLALILACAHPRTAEQKASMARGDCSELLRAADGARAQGQDELAADLAGACSQDRLLALADAAAPAQALLWCGRATAAGQKGCDGQRVAHFAAQLHPRLTIGPPDPETAGDPMVAWALEQLGSELNLAWQAEDPDVIVGKLSVTLDHLTSPTTAMVTDAKGNKQRVPATQHRYVARASAQVGLGDKTRTLHATEEARDNTWEAAPRQSVQARFEPSVPSGDELKKRAVLGWLRALAKALAASPPEAVDVSDDKGCVAYGLSLNFGSGDALSAARGRGDPAKVAACEKLLGEPPGAGIPVP